MGFCAKPPASASQLAARMPLGLPITRPATIPSGTGASSLASVSPASETPALAKANSGKITKAIQGCNCSSRRSSREVPWAPLGEGDGRGDHHPRQRGVNARLQDAQPDRQANEQIGRQPCHAGAVQDGKHARRAGGGQERAPVQIAGMRMLPKSSRMASASRKILSDQGTCRRAMPARRPQRQCRSPPE